MKVWQRSGSCTAGCGACCRTMLLPLHPGMTLRADYQRWAELHGVAFVQRNGVTWARLPLACQALTADGMCALHGQPERPRMCADFPLAPSDLLELPECTYRFETHEAPLAAGRR